MIDVYGKNLARGRPNPTRMLLLGRVTMLVAMAGAVVLASTGVDILVMLVIAGGLWGAIVFPVIASVYWDASPSPTSRPTSPDGTPTAGVASQRQAVADYEVAAVARARDLLVDGLGAGWVCVRPQAGPGRHVEPGGSFAEVVAVPTSEIANGEEAPVHRWGAARRP